MADGAYANQTLAHVSGAIRERKFQVTLTDLTEQLGVFSIQGPNRYLAMCEQRIVHL